MAKLKLKSAKKKKPGKKSRRKVSGRGMKVLILVFCLALLLGLTFVVQNLTEAINASRSIQVATDMEMGAPGDGPGQFKEPQDVATDSQGNFYVSDFSGHRIQKFDPKGTPVYSIGKEGKEEGDFEQPSGLYVDGQGILYVCDTFNHRIEKFDAEGNFVKTWSHSFFGPRSIVATNQNRVYVSDTGNHKIQVFDANGNFIQEWGGFGTQNGKFREPVGITADPEGNIYVADSDNLRIQKFDSNGKFIAAFKISTWRGKNDEVPYLTFGQGFLYASNSSQNTVLKMDPNGKLIAICRKNNRDAKKDGEGFSRAAGVAVDSQDHVYVVEKGNGKIARFTVPLAPPGK
jgi:tripartite motif-containing protein 71